MSKILQKTVRKFSQWSSAKKARFHGTYEKKVWLLGAPRSGTTWILQLLNSQNQYRILFEPFHPLKVREAKFITPHYYRSPNSNDTKLERLSRKVFSGKLANTWTERLNKTHGHKNLLVKDVFANLLASKVLEDDVKALFVVRNPYAVAYSKWLKKDWFWMKDVRDFLKNDELVKDHLSDHVDLINEVGESGDFLVNQIAIWCIIQSIPFKTLDNSKVCYLFYEDLKENPESEMRRVNAYIGETEKNLKALSRDLIDRPSPVSSRKSSENWKEYFSQDQLDKAAEVIKSFGLEGLYDANGNPSKLKLAELINK